MICNSYELLKYMSTKLSKGNVFSVNDASIADTGLTQEEFKQFANELISKGYVTRYLRLLRITDKGLEQI